jgi:N-acetylglucosaminyldiphosphoundecaprenol N-acetyl-beta-D-mannosaminyltransferase
MPPSTKHNVLGIYVDAVDYDAAVDVIISAARSGRPLAVTALAVHGVMTGVQDPIHRYRLNHLDLVVADGQPVRWALNWLHGVQLAERVYGPNLMLRLCERASTEALPIYLYGSRQATLEALSTNLRRRFPQLRVAGMEPSRFRQLSIEEADATAERIRKSGAAITFVGLGCPRQEVWAYENRERLSMPLVAVGAAFDFHAGSLAQAPEQFQRRGLEWAYRLWREPRRLWRRYVFLNPAYLGLLVLQLSRLHAFDPPRDRAPSQQLRYG